jgi:hypothetical protein
MPRLPIVNRSFFTWGAIFMLAAAALPTVSDAAVIVRSAKQLSQQQEVRRWVPLYEALSGANVAYAQCGSDYGITDVQRAYLNDLFIATSKSYTQAYVNVYITRVGYEPTQPFVDEVSKILQAQQQQVVNQTALAIQQQGCRDAVIENIITYPEKHRYITQQGIQNQGSH